MHARYSKWGKHFDFIVIDLICINLSLYLAYICRHIMGNGTLTYNMYALNGYRAILIYAMAVHLVIVFLTDYYSGILTRGYFGEFKKVLIQNLIIFSMIIFFLFALQIGSSFSRTVIIVFMFFDVLLMYLLHIALKKIILSRQSNTNKKERLMLVTTTAEAENAIKKLMDGPNKQYYLIGLSLREEDGTEQEIMGVPVVARGLDVYNYVCRHIVDEVVICLERKYIEEANRIANIFLEMGIPAHIKVDFSLEGMPNLLFSSINNLNVITTSNNTVSELELFLKRIIDILAGMVGCIITGILFIFIAPAIKIADPKGPVFFSQMRVGRNGRTFKFYKFRSMYSDAEERKAELMEKNKMNGLMFKVDADPRVLGSGPDGTRKGLGNFLRTSSLDEFPNFWSILKGDMSLVGTRPPTMDEYEKYELHHKSRLATKPGLTGMWQISGRSDITDFEEIVKMDSEYIKNWNLGKDIKIILKTVWVVLTGKGSQ